MAEDLPKEVKAPLGLKLIAGTKLVKGVTVACVSLGIFDVVHKDVAALALHVVQVVRISPENHYVVLALDKLGVVKASTLVHLGILSALYASVELVEGLGLWLGAAWAEYVVVVSTGLFVPEEFAGTLDHFTWLRFAILVINAAILVYVAALVRRRYVHRRAAGSAARAQA